jgi:hypothetical protein
MSTGSLSPFRGVPSATLRRRTRRLWLPANKVSKVLKTYGASRSQRMARPVRKWFRDDNLRPVCINVSGLGGEPPAKMEIRASRS